MKAQEHAETGEVSNKRFHEKQNEFKCPCSLLSGINCPQCEGKEGKGKCKVCDCECDIGPIPRNKFQGVARAATSRRLGIKEGEPLRTATDKRNAFGRVVRDAITAGTRDVLFNGVTTEGDQGVKNIMGAASHHMASAVLEDGIQAQIQHDMGAPTNAYDDETPVELIQTNPKSHRFYRNGLSKSPRLPRSTQPPVNNSTGQQQSCNTQPSAANSPSTDPQHDLDTAPTSTLVEFQDDIILEAAKIVTSGDPVTGKLIIDSISNDKGTRLVVETFHRRKKSVEEVMKVLKALYITPTPA